MAFHSADLVGSMIDLRSDTVTRPTQGMRAAMAKAPLGDDVFRDDPSVLALEACAAELLGKQAALYVPTGTMANQIALRIHCRHGDELVAHRRCHIFNYETGAAAALAGVDAHDLRILLAHQPKSCHAAKSHAFDLQLSGHTHGGQIYL